MMYTIKDTDVLFHKFLQVDKRLLDAHDKAHANGDTQHLHLQPALDALTEIRLAVAEHTYISRWNDKNNKDCNCDTCLEIETVLANLCMCSACTGDLLEID